MKIRQKKIVIPTYPVGKPEPLPLFFEKRPYQGASGKVYPIPYVPTLSDEKEDVAYEGYVLENEYIRVELLPELGGKIHSALDKTNGYDFIYHNRVIKPAMVGLAGPWVSGGIEFNWPQHHRPTTFMPVQSAIAQSNGRKAVYMGEVDYFHRMKGMLALSVEDGCSCIRADVTVYNGTPLAHPFMWWANMAVQVDPNYRIVFPPDVEYVNDHDRRAVLSWPMAKGVYQTARPYDYGDGTDIHIFSAVKVPSSFMVSKGQSDGDFVCGYDMDGGRGVVTVADHHIAPGKKLWTWGSGKFGEKWCSNLTDDGSQYVELMTGCYTDNQPDFTWIAPYETKKFTQYWYPVREIGEVKCATPEGACNLETREGSIFVGFYATRERKNCRIVLTESGKVLYETYADVSPSAPFCQILGKGAVQAGMCLQVYASDSSMLLEYVVPKRGTKQPISPRLPAVAPEELGTTEELWLNGIHLEQYKHFAFCAEDYFKEALLRDEGDVRSNEAMGDECLRRGEYDRAETFYSRAISRLTLRNDNPYHTEPLYKRALCRFARKDWKGAEDDAWRSVWSYPVRSAGYYLLAKIAAQKGNREECLALLEKSLETNDSHLWAKYIRAVLTGDEAGRKAISKEDPLFFEGMDIARRAIDFVIELLDFKCIDLAREILLHAKDGAMKFYYLAFLSKAEGDLTAQRKYTEMADACDWKCEFPARAESLAVLESAGTPMAEYYRGCILYNFGRWEDACAAWEKTVGEKDFAPALRNLALGYYDHLSRPEDARRCLEKAFASAPESDRIFYELTQLYKALNLPIAERLALYEQHPALTQKRDDCTLAYSVLCTIIGDYDRAKAILDAHRFHTYEGGEGYLTQHHAWLHFLIGNQLLQQGRAEEAVSALLAGLVFPENYGEEKNYFVNDAPIYLTLASCMKVLGKMQEEQSYLTLALSTKGSATVHSYFQCEALRRLGRDEEANALAREMLRIGEERIANAALDDYYGVGSPVYPPFGYDIEKAHTLTGNLMTAFASLALGDKSRARRSAAVAQQIDSADFSLCLLQKLLDAVL